MKNKLQKVLKQLTNRESKVNLKAELNVPILERLSWIASILSLLLGVLVWILPSPTNIYLLFSPQTSIGLGDIVRLVLFSVFAGLGIALIIQRGFHRKMGSSESKASFYLQVTGDWSSAMLLGSGLIVIFVSAMLAIIAIYTQIALCSLPVLALFGVGLDLLISYSRNHMGYIQGTGKIKVDAETSFILRTIIITLLFSLSLVIIMVVKTFISL